MNLPLLPRKTDERLILGGVVLGLLLVAAGAKILRQQEYIAALEARPAVADRKAETRTADVSRGPIKRGPVTISKKVTTAPDGTKTVETARRVESEEVGPVESRIEAKIEVTHQEVPAAPVKHPGTRYLGVGVDPWDYARLPRLRAGLTFWDCLDAGIAYDARRPLLGGALSIEAAWRF